MKAIAKCPKCGEEVTTTNENTIKGGFLVHNCTNDPDKMVSDVEWKNKKMKMGEIENA